MTVSRALQNLRVVRPVVMVVSRTLTNARRSAGVLASCQEAEFFAADIINFSTRASDLVLVDVCGLEKGHALEDVATVAALVSNVPIVTLADTKATAGSLKQSIDTGSCAILFRDFQDANILTFHLILEAAAVCTARDVCPGIEDPWLRDFVFEAVSSVAWNQRVPDIARMQSLSRRQLQRRLAISQLHSVKNLQQWARLLVGAWILSRRWRLIRDLALDLGWADDGGLESASFERLRVKPSALCCASGFARVKTEFLDLIGT